MDSRPKGLENWGPYRWLWQRTTGQPYTWIARKSPLLIFAPVLILLIMFLTLDFENKYAKAALRTGVVFLGLILGHVFW